MSGVDILLPTQCCVGGVLRTGMSLTLKWSLAQRAVVMSIGISRARLFVKVCLPLRWSFGKFNENSSYPVLRISEKWQFCSVRKFILFWKHAIGFSEQDLQTLSF